MYEIPVRGLLREYTYVFEGREPQPQMQFSSATLRNDFIPCGISSGSGISSGNRHGTSAHSISDYPAFRIPNRR